MWRGEVLNVKRKAVSGILASLLLMSILTTLFNVQPVEAENTPLINPVPGQYANYTMYFQNGTAYGWCKITYNSYETSIFVNVSVEQQVMDNYGDTWYLVNVMNREWFEGENYFWPFCIETDIKIDDEVALEVYLSKVIDSGVIDVAGFTREYWILEAAHPDPSENIIWLWGFDKETGILIYVKTFFPEVETSFLLTSTNIFTNHIGNVLYWIEGMADWENLEAYPTPAKVGDDIHLKVYWWNDGSAAAVGNVTAQPTAPSYKYYVPDEVQDQNTSISPGGDAAVQFDPVNLNESGRWTFLGRLDLDDVDWIDYKQIPFVVESEEPEAETEPDIIAEAEEPEFIEFNRDYEIWRQPDEGMFYSNVTEHITIIGVTLEDIRINIDQYIKDQEEPEPESSFGDKIPGFSYESIILGLIAVIIIIWRARNL